MIRIFPEPKQVLERGGDIPLIERLDFDIEPIGDVTSKEVRELARFRLASHADLLRAEGPGLRVTVREGDGPKVVREMLAANGDIAALVLGAAPSGAPGKLVTHFTGADAGKLTVPVMIIPGSLDMDAIDRLS